MSIILQILYNFYVISLQILTKKKQNTTRVYQDSRIQSYSRIFQHIHAFQIYPDIIRHIQEYSGVTQAYFEPCVTLTYSELCYIQNRDIFKTRGLFRTLVYPKFWHIQNQRHIQNCTIQNLGIFRIGVILRTFSNIYDGVLLETGNGYNCFLQL